MKRITSLLVVVLFIASFTMVSFASTDLSPAEKIFYSENQSINTGIADQKSATTEINAEKLNRTEIKAIKSSLQPLYDQLLVLRATVKSNFEQIKSLNEQIKTTLKSTRLKAKGNKSDAMKTFAANLKTQMDSFQAQAETIRADMKTIRDNKQQKWTEFRAALKAKDVDLSSLKLNEILVLKGNIITKQQSLIMLKQLVLKTINELVIPVAPVAQTTPENAL